MSRVHYFQRGNTEKVTSNEAIFLSYTLTKCKNLREHCVMVGIHEGKPVMHYVLLGTEEVSWW